MGIKTERKVLIQRDKSGRIKSKALSIPPELETEDRHVMAANAIIISDPTGVLTKDELYQILEDYIEPIYWEKKRKFQNQTVK